jgi:helicase MOV-10
MFPSVAITRAQSLLVIIGDPQVLGLDNLWRRFLYFIHHSGGWKGAPFPWNPDANPDDLEVASAHAEQVLLELLRRAHPQEMETVDELGHVGTSDA